MESFLIFAIALLLVQQGIANKIQPNNICPLNEVYNECGSACPLTCDNYKSPPEFCTMQCVMGCECEKGYVRNSADGSCCLETECPEPEQICPLNEVYNECGSACPLTCDNYKSPPEFCTRQCVLGCECEKGYVRNSADGSCCLETECPEPEQICPLNEVYTECGSACPITCDNYKSPPEFCTDNCVIGCQCEEGYIRNSADGSCCLETECPEPEQICPLNEVYNECGSACPRTCDNKDSEIMCTMQCVIGCECEEGYVRNSADGSCCLETECPAPQPVCPLNQEYKACGSACPLTCENHRNPPQICTKNCVAGCHCKAGYVKAANGSCCSPSQCSSRDNLLSLIRRLLFGQRKC